MKNCCKIFVSILLFSLTLSLFSVFLLAEEEQPVLVETQQITGNLTAADQINEHTVTVLEAGDLLITIAGLQDQWDGYTYHWKAKILAPDKTTVLAEESVRGYCGIEGYATQISLSDVEAGEYVVQMTSVSFANPLMGNFIEDPYQISVTPFYDSVPQTPPSDRLKKVSKAGEVICKIGDTLYVKQYDGEAIAAVCNLSAGRMVPVLVSKDRDAVAYYCSKDGKISTSNGSVTHWEGDEYYSTYVGQTTSRGSEAGAPMFFAQHGDVEQILRQLDKETLSGWAYFWKYYKTVVIIGAIVVVVVVFCFICKGVSGGGGGGGGVSLNDMTGDEFWVTVSDAVAEDM